MSGSHFRLSFEFFPPKTPQGRTNLVRTAQRLNAVRPKFFSVTFGAGGSTRTNTFECVQELLSAGLTAAPHLSWGENAETEMVAFIHDYLELGVDRFVMLRGDAPSGAVGSVQHHAEELVRLTRAHFAQPLRIHVAGYPETHPDASSPDVDIEFLRLKFDAGADECITQYFYSFDAFAFFVEDCRNKGITAPIVPGIMPITNYEQLVRFSRNCGADIPRWIELRLSAYKDDLDSLQSFGKDVVVALCRKLIEAEVPGFHFYTLNKSKPTLDIIHALDLNNTSAQRESSIL